MGTAEQYATLTRQVAAEEFPNDPSMQELYYRLIQQECGFSPDVVEGRRLSSAGAQGIAQFMPDTAAWFRVNPFDPVPALHAGAQYLKGLIKNTGDVTKGVAAYNAGEGGVQQAVAAGGANWISALPAETQTYLSIILGGSTPQTQGGGTTMTNAPTQPTGDITQQVIQWMKTIYPDKPDPTTGEPTNWAAWYFSENPTNWIDYYRKNVLGGSEQPAPISEYQSRSVGVQEAQLGFDVEEALRKATIEVQTLGWDVAATNFANKMSQAQEARATAEFAQQYEQNLAPPGMTQYPGREKEGAYAQYMTSHGGTPREPVPLQPSSLPRNPYQALGQAQGVAPQAPELTFTPPTPVSVPSTPLPPTNVGYTAPTPVQAPYQGQSADALVGAGIQPLAPGQTPMSVTPQAGVQPMTMASQMTSFPTPGGTDFTTFAKMIQEALRRISGPMAPR